jgi:hypothetical protein
MKACVNLSGRILRLKEASEDALENPILLFEITRSSGRTGEAKEIADGQNMILCHTQVICVPCSWEKSTNIQCDLQADV